MRLANAAAKDELPTVYPLDDSLICSPITKIGRCEKGRGGLPKANVALTPSHYGTGEMTVSGTLQTNSKSPLTRLSQPR